MDTTTRNKKNIQARGTPNARGKISQLLQVNLKFFTTLDTNKSSALLKASS